MALPERTYFLDASNRARDPETPQKILRGAWIREGKAPDGTACTWRQVPKPSTRKAQSALEPLDTARVTYGAAEQGGDGAAEPFGLLGSGETPAPAAPSSASTSAPASEAEQPASTPIAPPSSSTETTAAPAAAPSSSAPASSAAEPTPTQTTYAAPAPAAVPLPPKTVPRCGHPDCARCAYARDLCAIHDTAIVPKPTPEAVMEHARGFLGATIGGTSVVLTGVGMFVPLLRGLEVRLPTDEDVKRIADHLAEVEWRYMPTVANHSAVTALVSATGSILGGRLMEVGGQVWLRIQQVAQAQQDAQAQVDAAATTAEQVRRQESPSPADAPAPQAETAPAQPVAGVTALRFVDRGDGTMGVG